MADVETARYGRVGIYEDVATQGSYEDSRYRGTVYVYISHSQNYGTLTLDSFSTSYTSCRYLFSLILCETLLSSTHSVSLVEPLSPLKPLSNRVIRLKVDFLSTRGSDSPSFADSLSVALGAISRFPTAS
jgi:hypothetical protein